MAVRTFWWLRSPRPTSSVIVFWTELGGTCGTATTGTFGASAQRSVAFGFTVRPYTRNRSYLVVALSAFVFIEHSLASQYLWSLWLEQRYHQERRRVRLQNGFVLPRDCVCLVVALSVIWRGG